MNSRTVYVTPPAERLPLPQRSYFTTTQRAAPAPAMPAQGRAAASGHGGLARPHPAVQQEDDILTKDEKAKLLAAMAEAQKWDRVARNLLSGAAQDRADAAKEELYRLIEEEL